ncbi:MAG: lipocalin-like domain-containing protein [Rubrivivax sp.]
MNPARRRALAWLALPVLALPAAAQPSADDAVRRGRVLRWPRDHGAHLGQRTEWWYATGWLGTPEAPSHGFQVTFFRSRTGLAEDLPGRLAPRQLLFAHAAVTDLGARHHRHAQRLLRWNGGLDEQAAAGAAQADARLWIARWSLQRGAGGWQAHVDSTDDGDAWALDLQLQPTQPLLLQGDAGFSRKGPLETQASHYYSEPQLAAQARLRLDGRTLAAGGRAWLDHEWSDEVLALDAVGWDWIGLNGFDGSALTAFQVRRADGSALWAGGSHRASDGRSQSFAPDAVRWQPGRRWRSPATGAGYPVEWQVQTPAGTLAVRALLDGQELDSRQSSGTLYWEGLSEWLDAGGRRVGLGYLEMTGYAGRLRL